MKEFTISVKDGIKETQLVVTSNKPSFGFLDAVYQLKTAYYEGVLETSHGGRILEQSEHGSYRTLLDEIPVSFLNKNNIFVIAEGKSLCVDATVSIDDVLMEHYEVEMWKKLEDLNLSQICNWICHSIYMSEEVSLERNPLKYPENPHMLSKAEVYEITRCTYMQRNNERRATSM